MSVTISNISTKVRYLLGDVLKVGKDIFQFKTSQIFTLTEENATEVLSVYINDVPLADTLWAYDNDEQTVIILDTLNSDDIVTVNYKYNCSYSNTEIDSYVQAALIHISASNYKDFIVRANVIYPEPETREENLIAGVTGLLIEPDNKGYRLPDVSVSFPKDLPTHEKIRQFIAVFKKDTSGIIDVF